MTDATPHGCYPDNEAPAAWRYKCQHGEFVFMEKRLTDEQKARGYYLDDDDDYDDDGDRGPFQWSDETPLYVGAAQRPAMPSREAFETWAHADSRDLEPQECEEREDYNNHYYVSDDSNNAFIGWKAAGAAQPSPAADSGEDPYITDLKFANTQNIKAARKYKARLDYMEAKYGAIDWDGAVTSTARATPIDHSDEECPNFPGCHCVEHCCDGWKHPSPEFSSTHQEGH